MREAAWPLGALAIMLAVTAGVMFLPPARRERGATPEATSLVRNSAETTLRVRVPQEACAGDDSAHAFRVDLPDPTRPRVDRDCEDPAFRLMMIELQGVRPEVLQPREPRPPFVWEKADCKSLFAPLEDGVPHEEMSLMNYAPAPAGALQCLRTQSGDAIAVSGNLAVPKRWDVHFYYKGYNTSAFWEEDAVDERRLSAVVEALVAKLDQWSSPRG